MDLAALEAVLVARGDRVAAVLCEPIIGGGAGRVPPPDGTSRGQECAASTGCCFVLDEVITGLGRAGAWLAPTLWLRPDISAAGQRASPRYLPLALRVGWRVAEAILGEGFRMSSGTASRTPAQRRRAQRRWSNLDILEREKLWTRVRGTWQAGCSPHSFRCANLPVVADVRVGWGSSRACIQKHDVAEEVAGPPPKTGCSCA